MKQILIAVPFYRHEALVGTLTASLLACAADLAAVGAKVVFYNDSPDYPPLAEALAGAAVTLGGLLDRVATNAANIGFVQTMNLAVAEAVADGRHLLLLNSDTELTPGALPEMLRVLRLDGMHGFVNPRSDNATIATLPVAGRLGGRTGGAALEAYRAYAAGLPPVSYVPTAVGFCLLVRWQILAEFGGFDEVYGKGYNEENDLVMRASRVGFRAVLANHAFVAHLGEASFSLSDIPRDAWERRNRAILDQRYPEYAGHTGRYYDSPDFVAERLLACLVPDADGLLDVALDCSSFVAAHNGTFQAGRQLIAAAMRAWAGRWRVHVLCSQAVYDFHDYASLGVQRADPHGGACFAAIFRVGQPYDWNSLQRACLTGAVLGVYMLDTISLDCPVLASPALQNLWQFTMDQFDVLATQSRQTALTIELRLRVPAAMIRVVAPHSLDPADYLPPEAAAPAGDAAPGVAGQPTLLVVGNHYAHKYLIPTANAVAQALPGHQVVALGAPERARAGTQVQAEKGGTQAGGVQAGGTQAGGLPSGGARAGDGLADLPNLAAFSLGNATDGEIAAAYAAAAAIVFPSFAEGFGFPTLNALAARRPVFARRLSATEEIWEAQGRTPNVRFYDTTQELVDLLRTPPAWQAAPAAALAQPQSAEGIGAALEAAMRAASYGRIVARVQAMQFASDAGKLGQAPPGQGLADYRPATVAAHLVARRVEGWARGVFDRPMLFRLVRRAVRGGRAVRRWLR